MDNYAISPDDCLILLAVSKSSSIRDAARLLSCDPAGLLRKIQRIARENNLLQKKHGRWSLTEKSQALVAWTQESMLSQRAVVMSKKIVRISSTAWFAERVLIPQISSLEKYFFDKPDLQFSTPNQSFELELADGNCDFVVACHPPENPAIAHKQIVKEPWSIAISPTLAYEIRSGSKMAFNDLKEAPFIRHKETNPISLFPRVPPFEVKYSLSFDNLIGVRSALVNDLGWSIVPTALILDDLANKKLIQVGHRFELDRKICLWWLRDGSKARGRLTEMSAWVHEACTKI